MADTDPLTPVVAVINSNDDVVEMLRLSFEQAGFIVVSAHVDAIKRGQTSLADFVRAHKPKVIVFDLVPPCDRSYRFVEHLRQTGMLDGAHFVLTSTNADRAHELARPRQKSSRSSVSRTTSMPSRARSRKHRVRVRRGKANSMSELAQMMVGMQVRPSQPGAVRHRPEDRMDRPAAWMLGSDLGQ